MFTVLLHEDESGSNTILRERIKVEFPGEHDCRFSESPSGDFIPLAS